MNNSGNGVESIDHNSDIGECEENGGYWANGFVANASWVRIDSEHDKATIDSFLNGQLNWTTATQSWSQGAFRYAGFQSPDRLQGDWEADRERDFERDLFSWQSFGAGQTHAQNTGYYGCVGNKMIPFKGLFAAAGAKTVEEAATHGAEAGSSKLGGAYYHFTDGRFTAWGSSSKVMVPAKAAQIAKVAKTASVVGLAVTDAELAEAIHACSEKLSGN